MYANRRFDNEGGAVGNDLTTFTMSGVVPIGLHKTIGGLWLRVPDVTGANLAERESNMSPIGAPASRRKYFFLFRQHGVSKPFDVNRCGV